MKKYEDFFVIQRVVPMRRCDLDKLKPNEEHEMWLIEPAELQAKINEIVHDYQQTVRAFVRPSGTEDVCRIYAEAPDEKVAREIAAKIELLMNSLN